MMIDSKEIDRKLVILIYEATKNKTFSKKSCNVVTFG